MQFFLVMTAALAAFASADVSHLGSNNYHAPVSTEVGISIPQKSYTQSQSLAQVESTKASVPVASFTIQQNLGQGQTFGSNSYSSSQTSGAYNYNAPVQQHSSLPVQQQSFSAPASVPIQQSCTSSEPAALQNTYLAPAPQQHFSSIGPVEQSTYSAPGPAPAQTYPNLAQNSYLPPVPQQQYSAPVPIQQQLHSAFAPAQEVQQSYSGPVSAPVQQSFSIPAAVQQQSYSSAGQFQQQSGQQQQQQQSYEGVKTTSAVDSGALSAPAPDQQSFSIPIPASVQQTNSVSSSAAKESSSFNYQPPASVQQPSYSAPFLASNQQSHGGIETNNAVSAGAYNYQAPSSAPTSVQQSFPAPATSPLQQSYSVPSSDNQQNHLSSVDSGSFNYQPTIPVQQSYSNPASTSAQQSDSAAVTSPIHQTGTTSFGSESGSYNYQPATPVQLHYSAPVQPSYSAPTSLGQVHQAVTTSAGVPAQQSGNNPVSSPQSVEYSVPAPQKITFPTPAIELSAPTQAPEVGTVYGANGGYVYRKF